MFIPNFPAPERAFGEYTGNPLIASLAEYNIDPSTGKPFVVPVTQPQGPNNPLGNTPGVPAMTITPAMAALLEGSQ